MFCAVLLWPILKEICLALAVVLNRSEIAKGLDCNINHNNDTFSAGFFGLELIWDFPSVKAKLNSVSLWMKYQGLAALAMAQEGTVTVPAKESHGLTCPLLLAQFLSTLMQVREDHSQFCATSLKSTPPLLLPPKLAPGQPCLKLLFHPPYSDHSHGWIISGVFGLQFSSQFLSTFLGFPHLTAKSDKPAQELFI